MIELADSSAWGKLHALDPTTEAAFMEQVRDGRIATCDHVIGEVLFSTRGHAEMVKTRANMTGLPYCPTRTTEYRRAFDVMQALAARGRHRQATFADCLIAAAAESAGVGLVHYDADFGAIASVTGQPTRALAPIGTL